METDLVALLRTLCPRVHPDVAPITTALPYVTYQHLGGRSQRFVDGQAASLRHSMVQINSWASTRAEALTLTRSIEDALCACAAFIARPDAEPLGDLDEDTDRRGCIQDFSIWSSR